MKDFRHFFNKVKLKFLKYGCIVVLSILLIGFLQDSPTSAQDNFNPDLKSDTALVTLDGRPILKVSSTDSYTASERGELMSAKLQDAVISKQPLKLQVRQLNELPTIWINNSYLLTVTSRDTLGENLPEQQAEIWAAEIQQAVNRARQERTTEFIQDALVRSGIVLLWTILIHWLLGWLWQKSLRRLLTLIFPSQNSIEPSEQLQGLDLLLNLTLTAARIGLWLATILYLTNQFPYTRRLGYHIGGTLVSTFTSKIITINNSSYSIPDLVILASLLWLLIVFSQTITDLLRSRILIATRISRGAQEVVAVISRYVFISIGTIVILQIWGLDLSSLTILASAFGVGIGFGFQDIAKNFGSGLVLLFERPFQIGDFVEVGGFTGTVERIGPRSTIIKTLDQVSIIVPNSRFLETELINWHHDSPISGIRLPIGVAYGSNVELVRQSLLEVSKGNSDLLSFPTPQVLFKGFGESSLNFELRVWTTQPSRQMVIKSDLYYKIEAALREHNIEIPFPQRDINVRGTLPVELSPEVHELLLKLSQQQSNGKNSQGG